MERKPDDVLEERIFSILETMALSSEFCTEKKFFRKDKAIEAMNKLRGTGNGNL